MTIDIHDVTGRVVRQLQGHHAGAGRYQVVWDGTSAVSGQVAAGVYLAAVQFESQRSVLKLQLLR